MIIIIIIRVRKWLIKNKNANFEIGEKIRHTSDR